MITRCTLRRAAIVSLLLMTFVFQETWALAGVTGNLAGTIKDPSGAPIAGVQVQAVSASQSKTATTDAGGRFVLLSLAPDSYTLSLTKAGYENASLPGVNIFADQTEQVDYTMQKALKTIGHVVSQAGSSLVKPGVGSDLYSVNSAQATAAAALGGSGNLNSTYSAMASVPGVQTSQGGIGWTANAAYVRGQNSNYTGFEYDGIPVNRAFDNYNSSTESTLGLQELQVYTGGGPTSVASAGTAGFINQVIKTGTFPGFAVANLGVGTPTFYHQAQVEIGGSTPDRTFSYYVGLLGYNQDFRILDNSNGAGYGTPGGIFSGNPEGFGIGYGFGSDQALGVAAPICYNLSLCNGVKPMCSLVTAAWKTPPPAGCWQYYSGVGGSPSQVADRENVVNLHMGIPKHNGLRDDVQVLWSASSLYNYGYNSPSDLGPGVSQFFYSLYGTHYAPPTCGPETIGPGLTVNGCTSSGQIASLAPYGVVCGKTPVSNPTLGCAPTYLAYSDAVTYNLPFGSPIATNAGKIKPPSPYYVPNVPAHPFNGPVPLYDNSINGNQNNTGVAKLQYTYALSQSAYLRLYGYSFYSDWFLTSPTFAAAGQIVPSFPGAAQYQLMTHTAGGALDFQDQINDKNLLSLDGNYSTAGVTRFNNSTANGGTSPIGYMALRNGKYTCYDPATGRPQICLALPGGESYYDVGKGMLSPTWTADASTGPTGFARADSPAAKAGATWDTLWNGNADGAFNNVRPRFVNGALSDQFRPDDKFLFNLAIRYDDFTYVLPDSLTASTQFYANMTANYTCVFAATSQVLSQPLAAGQPPPASAQYVNGDCNAAATALHPSGPHTGWVHPNGTVQDGVQAPNFTASSPGSFPLNYWQPRFSMTYTASPDTVVRASAGRYAQPPLSSSVQYLSLSGDERSTWNNAMNLGFYSPFHPIPGISSAQYDISLEHHLRGTDLSFKLTPFYTRVSDWQQETFIPGGSVTQIPVGVNRIDGVEFQVSKGDFTRNGLSGQLAFTYTNSKVQFQNVPLSTGGIVPNTTVALNQAIAQYNALTKAGGGSPCYQDRQPVSCSTPDNTKAKGFDTIRNPYYDAPLQSQLNPNGWYNPYNLAVAPNLNGAVNSYISPYISSLIVNWRHDKLAITPSFNFQSGGFYGSPLDTEGVDPRTCMQNSAAAGITKVSPKTNPLQCNYLSLTAPGLGPFSFLYVPNPQTGAFLFDNYEQPNSIFGNLAVSYDVSPRIRLTAMGVNLFHACFGGTAAPWTAANPPSNVVCGYTPEGGSLNGTLYPSNFYNGTSINDVAANRGRTPFTQSYLPSNLNNGAIGGSAPPINVFFNAQVRI
ncbi:MAG: carboxypeptidase regulatory-like domain-containing protein [Candidatus Cybelea sp.]